MVLLLTPAASIEGYSGCGHVATPFINCTLKKLTKVT